MQIFVESLVCGRGNTLLFARRAMEWLTESLARFGAGGLTQGRDGSGGFFCAWTV